MNSESLHRLTGGTPGRRWALHLNRPVAGLLLLASSSLLIVAAWLDASPTGVGTHTGLGLPPCGFLASTGLPCATCGMTTAFALAADGHLLASLNAQPAGCILAIITAMLVLISSYALYSGLALTPLFRLLWRPATLIGLGVLVLGSWIYKIVYLHGIAS